MVLIASERRAAIEPPALPSASVTEAPRDPGETADERITAVPCSTKASVKRCASRLMGQGVRPPRPHRAGRGCAPTTGPRPPPAPRRGGAPPVTVVWSEASRSRRAGAGDGPKMRQMPEHVADPGERLDHERPAGSRINAHGIGATMHRAQSCDPASRAAYKDGAAAAPCAGAG